MTGQYDPRGGPTVYEQPYATFTTPPSTTGAATVTVRGRQVELSTWIYLWVTGALVLSPFLAGLILLWLCHGVHQ